MSLPNHHGLTLRGRGLAGRLFFCTLIVDGSASQTELHVCSQQELPCEPRTGQRAAAGAARRLARRDPGSAHEYIPL